MMPPMPLQPKRLSNRQFDKYCALVYRECGIKLNEEKRALLNARLAKRLRQLDLCANAYYDRVLEDPQEMSRFIDAVSTNHTYFYRESKSFDFLRPEDTDIWSAACSSGEEPYSLATHCLRMGGTPAILATDISDSCLEKARVGVYPASAVRELPQELLRAYFQKGRNQWAGMVRVKPEVRRLVAYQKFNLHSGPLPERVFDVIFCRNVMIYFDGPTKERVVSRLAGVLRSGGYFIIGGAESLNGLRHPFTYIEPSVYRKS